MTTLLALPGSLIARVHTFLGALAFASALFIGWASGLWEPLCENAVSSWPVEWFPSVSAVIGDHAPPRAPFQIIIALCATPRFLLLAAQWLVHRHSPVQRKTINGASAGKSTSVNDPLLRTRASAKAVQAVDAAVQPIEDAIAAEEIRTGTTSADVELFVGIARTFCCGGWVYITSRDHHDIHDLFMIIYLLLTLPWMVLSMWNSTTHRIRRRRLLSLGGFLITIPPLIWMYHRHSNLRIPGAYTHYAFFEWSLVFWDVTFDSVAALELSHLKIAFIDTTHHTEKDHDRSNGVFLQSSIRARKSTATVDWADSITDDVVSTPGRAALAWLSDVYLAACFWTVFTGLTFQLFYWSVWKLALAGSELALLANLSGYMLVKQWNRDYVTSQQGLLTHRIFMVVFGMGCYFVPSVATRLMCISLGTWTGWLAQFGTFMRLRGSEEMIAEGQILGVGLAVTLLVKYANASTNPMWATTDWYSGGWNITALLLAAAALYEYATRPTALHPATPPSTLKDKPVALVNATRLQRILITIGFGSFIHMMQTFVTDSGTIIAWTWTGYPVKGPTLHPFASFVIGVACAGLVFPARLGKIYTPFLCCVGAAVLYNFPDWIGFVGGLLLVATLTSLLPLYVRLASAVPFASTLGNALLVNCLLDVVSVVTAAYAFVPYGWIFRERTDLVLVFCMGFIVAGALAGSTLRLPGGTTLRKRSQQRIENVQWWTTWAYLSLTAISLCASLTMMRTPTPTPYHPKHRVFSGGIWAVHFGVDESGRDSQRRMMELLRDMQVDVVGLLETDLHRMVYGNRDLTRIISEDLGYYVDLGPGPNKHTWGAALLSKFPILNSTHHLLPSPNGELAPAIHATLDIHGEKINVWVSHNGQEEDPLDRELQTIEIARNLRETEDVPTVFLGYLVTHPGDLRPWPYQILMEDGKMYDIEIEDQWRWCEYIAFRGLWRIGYARVHESDISDTELQVGKFMLALPGDKVVYESNEELYWHIGEEDIPEPWRMPREFRDEGLRGHKYVVWDGPVYYLPPERSNLRNYGGNWSTSLDAA